MRANLKLILIVSVPVSGEKLEDAIFNARKLTTDNILKFKHDVEYMDGSIAVLGADSEEPWDV